MSPKRPSMADRLGQEDDAENHVITSSRYHVTEAVPPTPELVADLPATIPKPTPAKTARTKPVKALTKDGSEYRRHTYHTSLYLPVEAQFALREIAITMRRAKPHDVMLEAMAELFEKYNKGKLAKECRARIGRKQEIT